MLLFTGVAMVTGLVRKGANSRSANCLPHRAELWPILHIFIFLIFKLYHSFLPIYFFITEKKRCGGGWRTGEDSPGGY